MLDSHLSTYGNLFWVVLTSRLSCVFVMNVCKFLMASSCVTVGQLASQCGVAWALCMWGVAGGFSLSVPLFASVSAISFPVMPIWGLTLWMYIKCGI